MRHLGLLQRRHHLLLPSPFSNNSSKNTSIPSPFQQTAQMYAHMIWKLGELGCLYFVWSTYTKTSIQEFKKLAASIAGGSGVSLDPQPTDLFKMQISLLPPVVVDSKPIGIEFGDFKYDVPLNPTFNKGDLISVTFWLTCPRNDLMVEGSLSCGDLARF